MGRLRFKPWAEDYLKESKYAITNPENFKGKWHKEVFNNKQPIWIEIGMGKGRFTIVQSVLHPEVNMIGIEKAASVQVIPVKNAVEQSLKNIKFINGDATNIMEWFEEESIDKIYINFPDPWPKARHEKRRLVYKENLLNYYKLLKPGGMIEFKTDQKDLFEFALEQVKEYTKYKVVNDSWNLHDEQIDVVTTEYELKFTSKGNPIFYVELHK